ncbi:hypothetical protein, partial [Methanocalculus sp.]|uniref:hypothetical protein n=1 Tax=Methanocalculus sp. TaxID=2004547 RepID=UPI002632C20B
KFSEFPRDLKRDFLFKTIRIFLVTDVRKSEATELFLRLNQGVAVSASEKRNCIYGPVKEHLREVITQYAILFSPETLGFSNLRMAYQDILDKIFFLEQKGNLNYKPNARALEAMYFNQNIDDSLKEHLNKNLEITQNAIQYFYQNYGFKLTKSIIISYYWFLREISSAEKYNLSSASNFLIEFEKWRGIQKFNYENNSSVNKKFIEFGTYLSKGWLDPSSIKGRHRILMDFYSEFINNGTIGEFDDQS